MRIGNTLDFPIILEGAHSTGKSLLGMKLAQYLGVPFREEIAREVLTANGVTADFDGLSAEQIAGIQLQILMAKRQQVEQGGPCVIDRGVPSVYAYSIRKLSSSKVSEEMLGYTKSMVTRHAATKGMYILLPPNIPLVKDGVRESQLYVREEVHLLIEGILAGNGYQYWKVTEDTVERRLKQCLRFIEQLNTQRSLAAPAIA